MASNNFFLTSSSNPKDIQLHYLFSFSFTCIYLFVLRVPTVFDRHFLTSVLLPQHIITDAMYISTHFLFPPTYIQSVSLMFSALFIILFVLPLLVLILFLHHRGCRQTERKRGGGLRPVGKVKLPATELCIKPFLWQLKLSPAYAHIALSFSLCILPPPFFFILEVTAVFQLSTCGFNHHIVAVYT